MGKKLNPTILIVEDDESIASVIRYNLQKANFNISLLDDPTLAIKTAIKLRPDVIILDWMMPKMTGIQVCKEIRKTQEISNTPILMLSARGEDLDKVTGLETGADDYLTKPFSPNELVARINALMRRMRPAFSGKTIIYEDITLDLETHSVIRNGETLVLSPIEFKILNLMLENPGKVFSRENLMDKIWGTDIYVGVRTIDVHITRLRKILIKASKDRKDIIKTIRLSGYTIRSNKGK